MNTPFTLAARLQRISAELERESLQARRDRVRRRARLLAIEARLAVAETLALISPDRQLCRGLLSDLDSSDLIA